MRTVLLVVFAISSISAQYSYNPPPPRNTYLPPPPPTTTTTTTKPYEAEENVLAEGLRPPPGEEWENANPFQFTYAVNDAETSNDFNHQQQSNGEVVQGEYRVQLPDGRTQIVKYTADWKNGFKSHTTYEGGTAAARAK